MSADMLCTRCQEIGLPKKAARGHFMLELFLWLCFILPGLFYTIWRISTRVNVCARCGSAELVPTDTEAARRIYAQTPAGREQAAFDELERRITQGRR
jgi:hypothetical protein